MNHLKKLGLIGLIITTPLLSNAKENPIQKIETKIQQTTEIVEEQLKEIERIRNSFPIKYDDSKLKYEIKITKHIYLEPQIEYQKSFYVGANKKTHSPYFGLTLKIKP